MIRTVGLAAALATAMAALPAPAAGPACSGTIQGAVTGSFTCTAIVSGGGGKIGFVISPLGALPAGVAVLAPCALDLPDPPRPGTYTLGNAAGRASLKTSGGTTYFAAKALGGEIVLDVTGVEDASAGAGKGYRLHGKARAVMQQVGGNGAVTVTTSF